MKTLLDLWRDFVSCDETQVVTLTMRNIFAFQWYGFTHGNYSRIIWHLKRRPLVNSRKKDIKITFFPCCRNPISAASFFQPEQHNTPSCPNLITVSTFYVIIIFLTNEWFLEILQWQDSSVQNRLWQMTRNDCRAKLYNIKLTRVVCVFFELEQKSPNIKG